MSSNELEKDARRHVTEGLCWFRSRDSCVCAVYYAVNRMENCDNSRFVTISSWNGIVS